MNERIQELARECNFDVTQIMAEVLCPDYSGPELFRVADAFNALPVEVRSGVLKVLENSQEDFAKAMIRECINREQLLSAIARGWCSEKNSYKVMDSDLALAIFDEVEKQIKQHFGVE